MASIKEIKQELRHRKWTEKIQECQRSGMTVKEWCRSSGIKLSTYYSRLKAAREEIKERTYDLKCNTQGRMIQVSVPATIPLKDYDYNAEVELINPVADTVANANYRGADVDWYVKADDIVLKSKENHNIDSPQNRLPQGQPKK